MNQAEQKELDALRAYVSYYKVTDSGMTAFGPWRSAAWNYRPGGYVDHSYYRAVCNTAAVGALVKSLDPGNPNVDWGRVKAILLAAVNEYWSKDGSPGWGFYNGTGNRGGLHWTTGFIGYPCALAAALTWNQLDANQKSAVRGALRDLATRLYWNRDRNYYSTKQSQEGGNTTSEEASAVASFLAVMSQFDPSYNGLPPEYVGSSAWLVAARDLMEWAFYDFDAQTDTVANHNMKPHPNYSLASLNDSARALVPWVAQGIRIQDSSLNHASGNDRLYGGNENGGGPDRFYTLYKAVMPYIRTNSDFTFDGRTYNLSNPNDYRDFRLKSYLGVAGVSDWGIGADFQNGAFAFTSWLDLTYYPSIQIGDYNYGRLLTWQSSDSGYGYLPSSNKNGCGSTQTSSGWYWGSLSASCGGSQTTGDTVGMVVEFFTPNNPARSLSGQVNTHFFLNSFSALNHIVGYLYMRSVFTSPYWSTPPNFAS